MSFIQISVKNLIYGKFDLNQSTKCPNSYFLFLLLNFNISFAFEMKFVIFEHRNR